MSEELTDKQRRFCEEYVIDFNGTQAAIRAGYSENSAVEIASQNLIKLNIQEYLSQLKKQAAETYGITKESLVKELARIAFFDIRRIYSNENELLNVKDFDDDSASAIAGLDTDEIFANREQIGVTKKVKLHSKIAAIERVSKMLGYDAPTIQETTLKGSAFHVEIIQPKIEE